MWHNKRLRRVHIREDRNHNYTPHQTNDNSCSKFTPPIFGNICSHIGRLLCAPMSSFVCPFKMIFNPNLGKCYHFKCFYFRNFSWFFIFAYVFSFLERKKIYVLPNWILHCQLSNLRNLKMPKKLSMVPTI